MKKVDKFKNANTVNAAESQAEHVENIENEYKQDVALKEETVKPVKENKFVEKEITDDIINIAGSTSDNALVKYKTSSIFVVRPSTQFM